ncbi:MAG: hypothetical protein AAGA03_14550 [Planctomycetota bacterium]
MSEIRPFRNCDLPGLVDSWVAHWSATGPPPRVSVAMTEKAMLSGQTFRPDRLLVAVSDAPHDEASAMLQWARKPWGLQTVHGWCHIQPLPGDSSSALIGVLCFTPDEGVQICDDLLVAAEESIRAQGFKQVVVGPLRDNASGYAGFSPIGHGVGVPVSDTRTSSLLSRHGYSITQSAVQMAIATPTYRAPIHRDWIRLKRTTRIEKVDVIPQDCVLSSAMSHLDQEQHVLVDHRAQTELACVQFWTSDPETQIMDCADAILDLTPQHEAGELSSEEQLLASSVVQTFSNRRIFRVETVIDQDQAKIIEQLTALGFSAEQQGNRWSKPLT